MTLILTERDLTNTENLTQARWELGRSTTEGMLAVWARKWGAAAIEAIDKPVRETSVEDEIELVRLETQVESLREAIQVCWEVCEKAFEQSDQPEANLSAALTNIETALNVLQDVL